MNKITISYKSTNLLIENLKKQENIQVLKKKNFFTKLFSKEEYAEVYFHFGTLDEKSIENIKNSKITIANSFGSMNEIIAKTKISYEKIKVIYPSINIKSNDYLDTKIKFCEKYEIDESFKLILFTAKNLKTSGIKEFLDICSSLSSQKFKILIAGTKSQITNLKFLLPKYDNLQDKIILLEDYKNIDELFWISDIFVLPTYNKTFSTNILKAMFCKCAVFLSLNNDAKEIVDVFSSMDSPTDPSTAFKIDAILLDNDEIEKIKKENKKVAQEATLQSNLEKFNYIIGTV